MYLDANEELESIAPEVRHVPGVLVVRLEIYRALRLRAPSLSKRGALSEFLKQIRMSRETCDWHTSPARISSWIATSAMLKAITRMWPRCNTIARCRCRTLVQGADPPQRDNLKGVILNQACDGRGGQGSRSALRSRSLCITAS